MDEISIFVKCANLMSITGVLFDAHDLCVRAFHLFITSNHVRAGFDLNELKSHGFECCMYHDTAPSPVSTI